MRITPAGLILLACYLLAPAPSPALAQLPPGSAKPQHTQLDKDDQGFLENAMRSGLFEIQAAKMAPQKSRSPDIKAYADKMIQDHAAINAALTRLAVTKGYDLPSEPSIEQKFELKTLDVSDTSFDSKYIQRMGATANHDAVNLFDQATKRSKDQDVKDFATETLPKLEAHLSEGRALEARVMRAPAGRPDTPR
ncbi:DUF4142 domain-containing protein [Achromobacter aloeverae]|nr:DUF4142 domain-containing protein [Achromobacter aloeverae]